MNSSARFLNPSEVARRFGVSAKALRLYEQRGLIAPIRSAAGWRAYGREEMARLGEIVALRALGLSLAQVAQVLGGDATGLELALAAHQAFLEEQIRRTAGLVEAVRGIRADLAQGQAPSAGDIARLLRPVSAPSVAFTLPWPWGGEQFELRDIKPLNYIIGPLGSGKTRLAQRLAEVLSNARFVGLDRLTEDGGAAARALLNSDAALKARIEPILAWLLEDGATASDALLALLCSLEVEGPAMLVVDMVEEALDAATQEALSAHLRRRGTAGRPLFLLTRSCAILDLTSVGPDEAIILCPANHSPPTRVAPYPGAPGYEAVATCLASPEVRARTQGLIARRL